MSTTTAKNGFAMPTAKEAMEGAKDLGLIAAGIIAGHSVVTLTKKDTAIVNGGLVVAGLGAAVAVKNPYVRMIGLGLAAFGTVKLLGSAVKEVAAPGTTDGLNGILPESVKAKLRKFIPTLSGMDDYAGVGNYDEFSGNDDFEGLSLDDVTGREEFSGSEEFSVEGLGEAATLAM